MRDSDWVLEAGHRLGIVAASSNAEWAISGHGEPNRNCILPDEESGDSGTTLRLPVSEGCRGLRTLPDESRTAVGGDVDTSAHTE